MIRYAILTWEERRRILFRALPMALIPALALLPAVIYLIFLSPLPYGPLIALFLTSILGLMAAWGIVLLVRVTLDASFDLITVVVCSAFIFLIVIGFYTGLFLAAFVTKG